MLSWQTWLLKEKLKEAASAIRTGANIAAGAMTKTNAQPDPLAVEVDRLYRNKRKYDLRRIDEERRQLHQARIVKPDIWSDPNPLVTVRIITYNRPRLLVERAIPSILRQTYQNFEVVVVGDHAVPETEVAIRELNDSRVRYYNLPERPTYAAFPRFFWCTAGTFAALKVYELAKGEWLTWLDDDDEYPPDHIENLLAVARARKLELVYGNSEHQLPDDTWKITGGEGFRPSGFCSGAVLYSSRLLCVKPDPFCWINNEPGDWNLWKRMKLVGARTGHVNKVVLRHYAELTMLSDAAGRERAALMKRKPTPQEILEDVHRVGADFLLRDESPLTG